MERTEMLFAESRKKAIISPENTFDYDYHYAATKLFAELPRWEKQARAMAYAIENQQIFIEPYDRIIGHTYYTNSKPIDADGRDIDYDTYYLRMDSFMEKDKMADPEYAELENYRQVSYSSPGHIAWDWDFILRYGTEGIRKRCEEGLARYKGVTESEQFYKGVLILLDALENWNEKHAVALDEMGMCEQAAIVRRVPKYPARTFYEAVQSFFMQFIVIMKENPFGGNSPGRMDYYLWPYLENDLKNGVITLDEARELVEELLIRIDERLYYIDGWVESAVIGGSHANGTSAVNPLSYMIIKAYMKYDITHPHVYVRIPRNAPADFVSLCADYVVNGKNRAQLLYDENIVRALVGNGVSESDAANYFCGGCMEVGVQGATSDFLFTGWHNVPKLLELCITGGYSLHDKKQLTYFKARPLTEFDDFEGFYASFIEKGRYILTRHLEKMDKISEYVHEHRPAYLISSMVADCLGRGRAMHDGGARYHDYGSSFIGIPNAADSLMAIKKAVFEEKFCTAYEMTEALKADFEGYEMLRARLQRLPKYGQENAEADALAARIARDFSSIFASQRNRFGGNGKPVLLSFVWSPEAGAMLGASPDGRRAGVPVAHSVTPQSASMTKGITAAINSCTKMPFECFSGGASAMWDLDKNLATPEIVQSLFMSFFEQGGHIFQGNMTDVQELKMALENPEQYGSLIVRVGGFSARFVTLNKSLQDDIINRMRHTK